MSKNFELLQRVAKDDVFRAAGVSADLPEEQASAVLPVKQDLPDTEITKLVQRLFSNSGKGIGPSVVCFSGVAREDRSSWICARAGQALAAQVDDPVCIVEANLWSPQLHHHVDAPNLIGLAEALTTPGPIQNFTEPLFARNLWLISSGLVKPNLYTPIERYRERFNELRETFSYVLVSAPALSREAEATFIGQLADGVVLIVEANQSRREATRRAKQQLEAANVQVLGAVLDQRTFPIPEKLYRRL